MLHIRKQFLFYKSQSSCSRRTYLILVNSSSLWTPGDKITILNQTTGNGII